MKLVMEALIKFSLGLILTALLIFVPAGTLDYLNAWAFLIMLFVPMFIVGIIMMFKNKNLLKSRLSAKEKLDTQSLVIKLSGLMFILGFVLAGLDFRFSWTRVPTWLVVTASILFLTAYLMYLEVLRENTYLSRTVEVQENQKVIDTGLYKMVRHPMYLVTLVLFLMVPLILGSFISLLCFLIYPALIIKRIKSEEKFLEQNLAGYLEYEKKVKYHLIPFIW